MLEILLWILLYACNYRNDYLDGVIGFVRLFMPILLVTRGDDKVKHIVISLHTSDSKCVLMAAGARKSPCQRAKINEALSMIHETRVCFATTYVKRYRY